ncbi:MAG: hypothetical protein KF847_21085, partial [Pirellulales bacterium]|nr:hypothetical protein [Pirellulales bacterium]
MPPRLPCCNPVGNPLPDSLRAYAHVLGGFPSPVICTEGLLALEWNGAAWQSNDPQGDAQVIVTPSCSGGNPVLHVEGMLDDGNCQANGSYNYPLDCNAVAANGYAGAANLECCPGAVAAPPFAVDVNQAKIMGGWPEEEFPPLSPCFTAPPDTCCDPRSGGGPGGSGGLGPGGGLGGGGGAGGGCADGICQILPAFSGEPVRYSDGELLLEADDLATSGFGLPWGHRRHYVHRRTVSENAGNGYGWIVEQCPYIARSFSGDVSVEGIRPYESYRFNRSGGSFASILPAIRQTLELDTTAQVYRFTDRDGTVTEFDESSGAFVRRIAPGGEMIEVTGWTSNGFNFTGVERTVVQGTDTIVEQYQYDYVSWTGDLVLQTLTLRRKVNAGAF